MLYLIPTDTCFGIACAVSGLESYKKIYEVKKRPFNKPLAIMVESFEWLEKNTNLNEKQIDFLKEYERPFTILVNTSNSLINLLPFLERKLHDIADGLLKNYSKLAFRVAHNPLQKKLIKKVGPIFLTSANFAGEEEIYEIGDLKKIFWRYIKEGVINLDYLGEKDLDNNIKPSDLFEFEGNSCDVDRVR